MAARPPRRLAESLHEAPVLKLDGYDYFVHPLSDGVPSADAGLLKETVEGLRQRLPASFDVLLTAEAMGLPLVAGLALSTGHPYLVARKRPYRLPGEIKVPYRTGYSGGDLHVNGLQGGQRVVIVDDVLSRGGTVRALASAIRTAGAQLVKVVVVFSKDPDLDGLSKELGCPVEALMQVRVEDGRLVEVASG